MTASTKTNQAPKGVAILLFASLRVYLRHWSVYLGYTAWLLIPLVVTVLAYSAFSAETVQMVDFLCLSAYLVLFFWVAVIIIIITPVLQAGKKFSPRRTSAEAWQQLIPYLLTYLIVSALIFTGTIAFVIPGVIFFVWFELALIAVVLERTPILSSLALSRELSRGRFWRVGWRLLIGAIILLLGYVLLYGAALWIGAAWHEVALEEYLLMPPSLIEEITYRLIDIAYFPLFVIYQVLLYLELKKTRPL